MSGQKVAATLGECCRCVTEGVADGSLEEAQWEFMACREALSDELVVLLQDAADMKWPFVPEKWQYKNSLTSEDKVNLKDLISENLSQLLAYLRAAILAGQPLWASSAIFLVDRFLYWTDDSRQLLRIARKLHQRYGGTPIAPQVVIRQARVYFSTGKLQKAEYILGSLISNSGSTGCWKYHSDSDRILVQAVSVQVRGQVLQKLGLWFEAAELICASLVGFYSLPQSDKKGIGTSLGILANILVSMDDKDFHRLMTSEHSHMSFFRKIQHRLLSAAEAAKMAVIYSQYASLYVLTNVVTQGTCLLSYSFSAECPASGKTTFLTEAKEAFEIGLLTKTEEDVVTSKQELHTFVKAAYALAITHKWLGSPHRVVTEAICVCQEASETYYTYCFKERADRNKLCKEIMRLVQNVKSLLKVEPFVNSDPGSFIPDTYRAAEDRTVVFTTDDFAKVMEKFQQHHQSVYKASKASCHRHDSVDGCDEGKSTPGLCVTSFGTATEIANTECATESQVHMEPAGVQQEGTKDMVSFYKSPTQQPACLHRNHGPTQTDTGDEEEPEHVGRNRKAKFSSSLLCSSLGSSWGIMTDSSRSNNQNTPNVLVDLSCPTEDDPLDSMALGSSAASMAKAGGQIEGKHRADASNISHPSQQPSHMVSGREGSRNHSMLSSKQRLPGTVAGQRSIETEDDESDMQKLHSRFMKVTTQGNKEGSFSSSLSSSFGSLSSWPKAPSFETQSSIDDGHTIERGSRVPTKANDGKAPSSSIPCNSSGQRGGKGAKDNTIPAISKAGSDQMSTETEDDLDGSNLSHASQSLKGPNQGNKNRTSSSSLGSSFGSLSPLPKVSSLATGSSVDDSQEVVGGNGIPTYKGNKECQNSSSQSNWSGQKGAESNKNSSMPVTATTPRAIPDQGSEETEDEPDNANLSHMEVGLQGIIQGSKEKPLSSSFSSSFGSSSSWQKVPSLDTLSSHSGSGQKGANEVLPTNQEGKSPKRHPVNTRGPTKSTFLSERLETKPDQGGLHKSDGVDSAEMEADIVNPVTHSSIAENATELKNGSSLTSSSCPRDAACNKCFPSHLADLGVLNDILTRQDYSALFTGVCHECLINRLPKKNIPSLPHNKPYGALLLKFSKATGLWTGRETNIYIGEYLQEGSQRKAFRVQFLHQEELLGSYVGKQYHKFEVTVHDHLNDVERQMTAQYYVTEFNKRLYEKNIIAQIFFIPSEVLLILEGGAIVGCVTAEPYMLGTFGKLTNNTRKVIKDNEAFQYGIAFGHFTYEYSYGEEVVVDLQGWVTEKGEGLTYLTDPQIHTLRKPYNRKSNFHQRGINLFLEEQHGPECNEICKKLCLGKLPMPKVAL
ncbi:hypothetical protein ACEWY4_024830 [Coilia grayii]|uniref:Alpha-type protein kinase domain-containing protein n=1 Tax=Coilia grayii TaxID=363190 RepID=A0ABD1IYX5_9TELE